MNWVDVFFISIIAIMGLRGLYMGLVLSFFSIASYIFAGIAAKIYYPILTNFILEKTNLITKIQSFILGKLKILAVGKDVFKGTEQVNIFKIMNFPKALQDLLLKSDTLQQYNQNVMDNMYNHVSLVITKMIVDLISIVVVFLLVKLLLNIIGFILNSIASLPVINSFNRLGGLIFGILKGIIMVYIIFALITPITVLSYDNSIVESLNNSYLAKYFYDYNIILDMLEGL
ncbi:CvpA family protein [Caminicella sporogenes]|uniref:CvpA family protein n=1 Tax=Caminicella sporogenes TaxID=166485 RepID=UPI0025411C5A|nr:CvpA family protein [Caminicella sporogenes]WIF95846.1 CvpA family protein [Caminicella sporogenes]